jgi:hemolysin III
MLHVLGLLFGGFGSIAMIGIALHRLDPGGWWPIIVYSACLLTMLGSSASYHLSPQSARRDLLRRLDHAAIFLMIAGTYTPFTARALPGDWAVAMTGSVWALALVGAYIKLRCPRRLERVDLALYLGLGWMIVIAWEPLVSSVDTTTIVLVILGGALYTIGTAFHVWRALRFQKAIWHGFVLVAAGCHYAAVLRVSF